MTRTLVYIFFFGLMILSLFRPWVGVIACYFIAIGGILSIWGWVFVGLRVVYYLAFAAFLGFSVAALSGKINFAPLKSKQNLYLLILWICLIFSYLFSPIKIPATIFSLQEQDPHYMIANISKVIFFYFISILLIDNKKKYHIMVWVILSNALFLIYWGNMEYFEGRLYEAGKGTLKGPGSETFVSNYVDENTFAMFFVMIIPYLFFMGRYYENKLPKYFLWLCIPFAWHCIFLTGSRGGIFGLSIVTLYIVIRAKSKILSLAIPVALMLAFIYQSGEVMKMRGESALNMEQDSSVQSRFDSWKTGIKIIIDHPFTGIGIGNFLRAYPHYSDKRPFVAHNTFIQFSSESGIGAGLMYLLLCFGIYWEFIKKRKLEALNIDPFLLAVKESLTASITGFFVCAIFLNVGTYEIFYFTLALHSIQKRLVSLDMQKEKHFKTQLDLS